MHATNDKFMITQKLSCDSTNVLYVIDCLKCKVQYLGKTTGSLKLRANKWRSDILKANKGQEKTKKVIKHFNDTPHSFARDFRIFAVEKLYGSKEAVRIRETMYIEKFDLIENGLNTNRT